MRGKALRLHRFSWSRRLYVLSEILVTDDFSCIEIGHELIDADLF